MNKSPLFDRRTALNRDVKFVLFFMLGVASLGLGNYFKAIASEPTWAEKQLHPELVKYSFDQIELAKIPPITEKEIKEYEDSLKPKPELVPAEKEEVSGEPSFIVSGYASYYSWDGCVGCNENRIMANGEQLNDDIPTVALYPRLMKQYINKMVVIRNETNGMIVRAKVTDSGGFERLGRVADLSVASMKAIGMRTDRDIITVYLED